MYYTIFDVLITIETDMENRINWNQFKNNSSYSFLFVNIAKKNYKFLKCENCYILPSYSHTDYSFLKTKCHCLYILHLLIWYTMYL